MDESTGSIVNLKVSDNRKEKCATMMILGLEAFKVFMACMLSLFVSQKCDDHVCNVSDIFHDDTPGNHAVIGLNFFTLFVFMIGYNIEYMREQYIIHHFNNNPKLSDHNIIKIIDKEPSVRSQLLIWNKRFYYITLLSIGLGVTNFGVSGTFICYNHYNGTRTLTSLLTNILLVSNTVYSNYKISKKSHREVFALSSSRLEPISYNDFDDKIKSNINEVVVNEEEKEESAEEPVEEVNNEVTPIQETETETTIKEVADTSQVEVEVAVQDDSTGETN